MRWIAGAALAASVTKANANAGVYDDVFRLVQKHGFLHPAPAGTGWDAYEVAETAVSAVYAWVPTTKSPPPLDTKTSDDNQLIKCAATPSTCFLDTETLASKTPDAAFTDIITELLKVYGNDSPQTTANEISHEDFDGFDEAKSRACTSDGQCVGRFGQDYSCCDKPLNAPGICCVTTSLNQYDATVPNWLIFFFLAGAGLLLTGWLLSSFKLLQTFTR